MRRLLLISATLGLSCSFTTATGFNECQIDTDCAASSACLEHYCIRLPDGCTRAFGDFKHTDSIPFAAVLPLTDNTGSRDESEFAGLNAFVQALEEMNQREGANGRRFGLYVCDTQRSDDRAKTQATWMADNIEPPVLITSGSGQTIAVSSATRGKGPMVMSATSTSPELISEFASSQGMLWRTAPPDTLQSRVLANLLLTDPTYSGAANIGVIYVDDPYGQGLALDLGNRLRAGGKTAILAQFTSGDATTIGAAVNRLVGPPAANATVVIGVSSDTKRIFTAAFQKPQLLRAAGHKWAFADASKDPDILTVAMAVTELAGSLGTAPSQGAGVPFPNFRDAYRTRFGIDPVNLSFTSHSYDAMYLLGLAASYGGGGNRTLSGRTMADAMNLFSSGLKYNLSPGEFSPMRNALTAGTSINVEGNSGSLDFIPDAGAPFSLIEEWRIEADAGFSTVGLINPPTN